MTAYINSVRGPALKALQTAFFACVILLPWQFARADTVYLQNGRSVAGIVIREDAAAVEVRIGIGTVRFRAGEVTRVERSQEHNERLQRQWADKKVKDEEDRQRQAYEEKLAAERERLRREMEPKTVHGAAGSMGHIIVQARINNKLVVPLLVDTGATVIVLSQSAADRLGILSDPSKVSAGKSQVADGRILDVKGVILDSVAVESVEARDVEAVVGAFSDKNGEAQGLLGMSFLKRFSFTVDSRNGKLILQKQS
jgi:clan AA aspartic protease (TIGR02281 family)